jgi:ankyrin repeat protein
MKAVERLLPKAVRLLLDKGADATYQLESTNMNSLLLLCSCTPKSKDPAISSSNKKKDKNKNKTEVKPEESKMEEDKDASKMEVENSKKKDSRLANDALEVEIGEMLIKAGCPVDSTLSNGRCALLLAVKNNKVGLARLLLEKGAKSDVKINGWSPLHIAVAVHFLDN